ncbi:MULTISPECIES: hypothetical protein [Cryobacterium]|uniref:Uncharacterized protein n=1 Tax=Cryobacterium breve TaxID=1259258 RepID=A0ABY2IUM5_9MICO|nr:MULTISPECIES: hypothetical protein [Cryobacterium]TFC93632.1 hypothetical protein E3T20_09980 [Cryobacterium sp. TmT3-12]TFC95314.1 hypothetical protein E3O65_14760 [Cryobacterium breve]
MSDTERGDDAEQHPTNQERSTSTNTNTDQPQADRPGTEPTPEDAAERLSAESAHESRLRVLRSKAAVARSEVDALTALHLDPDTLEDLLDTASPQEAARLLKSEHSISVRVVDARARAEITEAEYEQAVLDNFNEAER